MIFLASVVLFHFANAAMLPMAGQVLAKTHPGADIIALSACIIAAQLVMIVVVATVGWAMRRGIGRKTIFLVAFVTLPIRKCLFMLTDSPLGVVAIQLLDGCTGVMAVTPYGLRAVSASWDHTLRLWDLDSGNEIATFIGESHMHSCAIAPDGQTIIAGDVSGRVHFLRLVEVDETKPAIGDTKIQLLLRKEQDARSATES